MKKLKSLPIISLIIAFVLVLSGCSSKLKSTEEKAKNLYQQAVDNILKLDSLHLQQTLEIKASFFGMDIELPIYTDSKSVDIQSGNPFTQTHMEIADTDLISDFDYTLSADNDYIYVDQDDLKIKISKNHDEYEEISRLLGSFQMNPEDYINTLQDIELIENSDKSKTIKASVNPEEINSKMSDFFESYMNQIGDSLDSDILSDITLGITDANVEITISPDNYIDNIISNMNLSLKIKVQGITMSIDAEIKGKSQYLDIGKDIDIKRANPDDYTDYNDLMDLDLLDLNNNANPLGPTIGT